ncbi:MAG: alpha/beta fold hydrolase [Acidimicrobiia bacterium]
MEFEVRGETAYAATGNKPIDPEKKTVVFLHGAGQDHTIWVLPIRYFARHDRNVLAVDLPGHGRSSGPLLKTIEEISDWVVDVLDAAGIERVAVVGHSMGSLVALDTAGRHPDRVRSLAMVGVSIPLAVSDPLMDSAEKGSHDAINMMTYWSHSNAAAIGGSPTPGMWMTGGAMRLLEQAAPGVIYNDLRACDEYVSGLDRAAELGCPALLLLGEKDRMTPVRVAQAMRDIIPEQDTVIFKGAGHALLVERSDPVLDHLIRVV